MKRILNNIDLRHEFDQLMKDTGHWMVMRQAYPGRVCSCVDPVTNDTNPNCNLCIGSGRAYIDRFLKGRKSRPIRITQSLGAEQRTAVGVTSSPDYIFYLYRYIKPTADDYILEVALDERSREPLIPYHVVGIYDISDVREHRCVKGRVEFYSVTAERQSWSDFELGS